MPRLDVYDAGFRVVQQSERIERVGGGVRGTITGFSDESRRRLRDLLFRLPWADLCEERRNPAWACLQMVTVTYPGDWPTDPERWKRDLQTLIKRWKRQSRYQSWGIWKLEFQKRGAPHFHLLIGFERLTRVWDVQEWFKHNWYDVVCSGDIRHRYYGADAVGVHLSKRGASAVVSYLAKYLGKSVDIDGAVGRFWGAWGDIPSVARLVVVIPDWQDMVMFCRRLRRWARWSRYLSSRNASNNYTVYCDGKRIVQTLIRGLVSAIQIELDGVD